MVLTLWARTMRGVPLWYVSTAQGLGVLAIVAGVRLWRGERNGILLSRGLQALQVVQVYTAPLSYALVLGAHITQDFLSTSGRMRLGVSGTFTLLSGSTGPRGVSINVLALGALITLFRIRKPTVHVSNARDSTAPV